MGPSGGDFVILRVRRGHMAPWLGRASSSWGLGVSQNQEYHVGGPKNKDYSVLEPIWRSPYVGRLPLEVSQETPVYNL